MTKLAPRRAVLVAGAAAVAVTDLLVKAWAESALEAGLALGPVDLVLSHNPGGGVLPRR